MANAKPVRLCRYCGKPIHYLRHQNFYVHSNVTNGIGDWVRCPAPAGKAKAA